MEKENKTLWEESYDKDFVGKLSINPNQHRAIKALIKIIISQERTEWEQEMRQKIESLEATTWGNEVEYLAKDDVLALSGNELESCECHKSGLPSHCGKCIDS